MKTIDLAAHRGHTRDCPENTLRSLSKALECGAKYIEFDVHLNKEFDPVVLHDDNLMRTTGVDKCVFELSTDELTAIPAGEPQRFANKFPDIRIPLLQEIPGLLKTYPHAMAFVEIKRASIKNFGCAKTVRRIMDVLAPVLSQCIFISFDAQAILHARKLGAHSIGWVFEPWKAELYQKAINIAPEYLFTDHEGLPLNAGALWPGPWKWVVYEINDSRKIAEISQLGADIIETNAICDLL